VRAKGITDQGFTKVKAKRRDFFKALQLPPDESKFGSVRYGGSLDKWSRELRKEIGDGLSVLRPPGPAQTEFSLWMSSAGSFSSLHYDSWNNLYAMLAGQKRVVLVPPWEAHRLEMYPTAHPRARQARLYGSRGADAVGSASDWNWPAGLRFFEVTIGPGEALYIPAGWSHHLTALSTASSLALTV